MRFRNWLCEMPTISALFFSECTLKWFTPHKSNLSEKSLEFLEQVHWNILLTLSVILIHFSYMVSFLEIVRQSSVNIFLYTECIWNQLIYLKNVFVLFHLAINKSAWRWQVRIQIHCNKKNAFLDNIHGIKHNKR